MMKRLGDYIRPVDVRNRALKVTRLVGLTIDKAFIPSVANTIGTDLSNYKVILENQFACSLMQVSRDGKMPIAMFKGEPCIMSPAYPMFEVSKTNELLPEYLMMWFSRSEFDREASFYAVGGVRGSLEWNDFCDMQIPVPAIEKQREIVAEYNTLATRIETNKKLIATLEQTAGALYRHTFIDNIDPNNLPQGWRMGTLGEVLQKKGYIRGPFGSALKKDDMQKAGIPVYEQQHAIDNHRVFRYFVSEEKYRQLKRFSVKENDLVISCSGTIGKIIQIRDNDPVGIINQALLILRVDESIYSSELMKIFLTTSKGNVALLEESHGSAQVNIGKREQIEAISILIPPKEIIEELTSVFKSIDRTILLKNEELGLLNSVQALLLSKMGA
jgi:type I restriction enzyme S subunit